MNIFRMLLFWLFACLPVYAQQTPQLQKTGNGYRLTVNGAPFLMLAGELGNSTGTTKESMDSVWPRLGRLNVNTFLAPIYWELIEPEEGRFDYTSVDNLISGARANDMKLVFLWFGSWKNSMSSHVPGWVKTDQKRFPRARSASGESQEILTPFSDNNLNADLKAYTNLLQHIKTADPGGQTVILVQVENEIGMLPSARDYHALANEKFKAEIPDGLKHYLTKNKNSLNPEFFEVWKNNGSRVKGTWEEVFGPGLQTDEIFMAYYFALYTNRIALAGKKAYNLPVYVNAALNRPGVKPGDYPSAGPLPHVLDAWKAAAPDIDFYAPDFYNPQFRHWNDLYIRQGNPLFIPEHNFDDTVAAKALYAVGHYEALGFSPFAIEQQPGTPFSPKEEKLAAVYSVLAQAAPILHKSRGQHKTEAVLLDKDVSKATFVLGDYEFEAGHTFNLGWEPKSKQEAWDNAAAIVVQTAKNEFYYIGFGVSLTMKHTTKEAVKVGILKTELGSFKDGKWTVYQHLNGDQTHQGRHIRAFIDDVCIIRFTVYEYE